MSWKMARNSEPSTRADYFSGRCPRYDNEATVIVDSVGRVVCKTDLQKTYHRVGLKCSLLEENKGVKFSSCMDNCPLVPEKYI